MVVTDLGTIGYQDAFALQEKLAAEVFSGETPETLLLLEHPPVYTMGSGGKIWNVLDRDIVPVRINRGGDVTWHGPGQLVGYPIVNLGRRCRDLHRYLRFIEELLIAVTGDFQVEAWSIPGRTGIWTEEGKLAAIGVGVRRWVTMHGFALNVSPALSWFEKINPCGISSCPVTSLQGEKREAVPMADVKQKVIDKFQLLLDERLPLNVSSC